MKQPALPKTDTLADMFEQPRHRIYRMMCNTNDHASQVAKQHIHKTVRQRLHREMLALSLVHVALSSVVNFGSSEWSR